MSCQPPLVSYPLREALGSRSSLAVVLCLLVSLLGRVVFVVFSKIYMVWEEISAALLMLPSWLHPVLFCFYNSQPYGYEVIISL